MVKPMKSKEKERLVLRLTKVSEFMMPGIALHHNLAHEGEDMKQHSTKVTIIVNNFLSQGTVMNVFNCHLCAYPATLPNV